MKKIPIDTLLKRATYYAIQWQESVLDSIANVTDDTNLLLKAETVNFIKQLKEYRDNRWCLTSKTSESKIPSVVNNDTPKEPEMACYTFRWNEGGFNQVHAISKKTALEEVKKQFPTVNLTVNLSTLKRLGKHQEAKYWRNLPFFD